MSVTGNYGRLLGDLALLSGEVYADRVRAEMYKAGAEIVDKAQEMLGHEHPGLWAPLEESTRARRVSEGFPENEPLLRRGHLRDAVREIRRDRDSIEVGVSADDPTIIYATAMEFGFIHYYSNKFVDPRPFLGPAAEEVFSDLPGRFQRQIDLTLPKGG